MGTMVTSSPRNRVPAAGSSGRSSATPGRHPLVIGALEGVRVLAILAAIAVPVSAVCWFIGLAEQKPLSAILVWAIRGTVAAHGFAVDTGDFAFGLTPTLATVVCIALLSHAVARTTRALEVNETLEEAGVLDPVPSARYLGPAALVGVYALVVLGAGAAVGGMLPSPLGSGRFLLVVLMSVLLGTLRATEAPHAWARARWGDAVIGLVDEAGRAARRASVGLLVVGLLGVVALLALRFGTVTDVIDGYSDPLAAAIGLGVVHLVFLPTVLLLALAWMSGPGFSLSAAAVATPFTAFDSPVLPVPLLVAVPAAPPSWAPVLLLVPVLVGVVAVIGRRSWQDISWAAVAVTAGFLVVGATACALFARGALGPGGLATFGAVWAAGPAIGGLAALGVAAGRGMLSLGRR